MARGPTDCEQIFIVWNYKEKVDAQDRGNYQGLKGDALSMAWSLLVIPSRALSQKEALKMQSVWFGKCRKMHSSEQTYL